MPAKKSTSSSKKSTTRKKATTSGKRSSSKCMGDIDNLREKAYFLWLDKGCPENCAMDNWLEAERLSSN